MNEERIINGWMTFWHNGHVGIKDYDGNEVLSPTLGFTEIGKLRGSTAIASRQGKEGLIDTTGKPLCEFKYDLIVYIGEGCYKAGRLVRGNPDATILEYLDTRYEYEIINAEGKRLCGDYHYVSEVYNGEVTAALNGRCGIINLDGKVIVPFEHKYIQPMGEGMYLLSLDNSDNYYATIVDKDLNVLIPASMQYRDIHHFHHGAAVAFQNEKWGLVDTHGNHLCEFKYSYATECGEGYFRVEMGAKKNILRPDGSLVLRDWFNDVFDVEHGFFIIGNTIRKSKTNPKTCYIRGMAHVNGDIIFPAIFERMLWFGDKRAIYAQKDKRSYILTTDGSIYDPTGKHLPMKLNIDDKSFFENLANWVLPGIQFFYRDTNAHIDAKRIYRVGDTIRAGFFVETTTKLLKPAHRTRFIIASAHAAKFYEFEPMVESHPKIAEWNLAMFHYNSYFKVMDVYETMQCTQVFLLHIPTSAAILLQGYADFQFLDEVSERGLPLVTMARYSLDEKLWMGFHDRSFDEEWCERMEAPVGLDEDMSLCPLNPVPEPKDEHLAKFSKLVHYLAEDDDIEYITEISDNFPWKGIEGTVCEGCFFANTIIGKGEGCQKLKKDEFRESYVSGTCEHWKKDADTPSLFEEKQIWEQRKLDKQTDVFAKKLLQEFIQEKLDGNIDNLKTFNFAAERDDKYCNDIFPRCHIIRAIMCLAFADVWPEMNMDAMEHYKYWCDKINNVNNILGSNILDTYFKGMDKFHPSKEQFERALKVDHLTKTIGNIWVLPNKGGIMSIKEESKYKGYMDKFLQAIYAIYTQQKKVDKSLMGSFYQTRKQMNYQGEEAFNKLIKDMMLEDYVDYYGKPMELFDFVWCYMKDLEKDIYFKAVDKFCTFCEDSIPKRSERIIEKLKEIIK